MNLAEKISIVLLLTLIMCMASCSIKEKNENNEDHDMPGMVMISDQDRLLANIRSEVATIKSISEVTTLVGKTNLDERNIDILTARARGRVDQLYVKNPEEYVKQGQAVYALYSEELLADENDFLLALDQYEKATTQKDVTKELLDAARRKLLAWTLRDDQIRELEISKKASALMKFYSPHDGYVIDLPMQEGGYVEAGSPILKLSSLTTLWVETQVYADEIKYLKQNPSLLVEFETYPNEIFKGEIVFDNPMLEESQKVNLVRVQVLNANHKLKPGMMAYVYLNRNEKKNVLVIPKSALIVGSMISVWVEDEDGMFEQRMVTTGIENKTEVEIISGIEPGEKVVVSGAFFLTSESLIKQGSGMEGMKM